jgi:DNA invertase Pin-like site-specific DNA recombinase
MNQRCAIYARYSDSQQSPASIDDQIRKCSEYAASNGWSITNLQTFVDAALSGSGADRPGLQGFSMLPQINRGRLMSCWLMTRVEFRGICLMPSALLKT